MDKKALQKVLVSSAQKKTDEILRNYCIDAFSSEQYYDYIKDNLNTKVLEIPNVQLWVSPDSYLTNSTTLSMMTIAEEPYTYIQQLCVYDLPIDEPNFGEGKTGATKDHIFYHRYLAECIRVFQELLSYYPTHTVEVHDYSYMMYVLWCRTTETLLAKVEPRFKRFFTANMFNQFITTLTHPKNEDGPNINLIVYDAIGTATQCADVKYRYFRERFRRGFSPVTWFSDEHYREFLRDLIAPLRSARALQKDFKFWNMEFREADNFSEEIYNNMQGLLRGQYRSMNKILYTAFAEMTRGVPMSDILELLKGKVDEETYKLITNYIKICARSTFTHKYNFEPKILKHFENKQIPFTKYNYTLNLLPPHKVFSEVIINMDELRKEYPSCTEQQFSEVYLSAQAINSCRRTFVKKYTREDWSLCVKIVTGKSDFEFTDTVEKLNTKLISEQMDNFTARIV